MIRLVALLLLLTPSLAEAKIPWKKLEGGDDLMSNEKETAAKVMKGFPLYHGCKGTITRCLKKKPAIKSAWRLANYVVFLVGKGLDEKEVNKVLELRRQSARPKKIHTISVAGVPRRGKAKAKVTIVEYADFRCGHCALLGPIVKSVLAKKGDQVTLYFKPYPLRPGESVIAAIAALAAHRQGKFWKMHDLLFANPELHSKAGVETLAKRAGLDLGRFRAAMKDRNVLKQIDKNKIEGLRLGIKGTPTLFVNGKRYKLRKDRRHISERIDEELEMN